MTESAVTTEPPLYWQVYLRYPATGRRESIITALPGELHANGHYHVVACMPLAKVTVFRGRQPLPPSTSRHA